MKKRWKKDFKGSYDDDLHNDDNRNKITRLALLTYTVQSVAKRNFLACHFFREHDVVYYKGLIIKKCMPSVERLC